MMQNHQFSKARLGRLSTVMHGYVEREELQGILSSG